MNIITEKSPHPDNTGGADNTDQCKARIFLILLSSTLSERLAQLLEEQIAALPSGKLFIEGEICIAQIQ